MKQCLMRETRWRRLSLHSSELQWGGSVGKVEMSLGKLFLQLDHARGGVIKFKKKPCNAAL